MEGVLDIEENEIDPVYSLDALSAQMLAFFSYVLQISLGSYEQNANPEPSTGLITSGHTK